MTISKVIHFCIKVGFKELLFIYFIRCCVMCGIYSAIRIVSKTNMSCSNSVHGDSLGYKLCNNTWIITLSSQIF